MAELSINEFSDFVYTRLPPMYIQKDLELDEINPPLYNFLRAMFCGYTNEDGEYVMGAGETVISLANAFTYLIDPDKCPDTIFPYFYESFGFSYNPLVETKVNEKRESIIYYHRKFLSNLGELLRRRGTISGLRFLVRVLTGFEFQYTYERNPEDKPLGRYLTIHLLINSAEDEENLAVSKQVLEQFLAPFVPHYITFIIGESVTYSTIEVSQGIIPVMPYSTSYSSEVSVDVDATKIGEEDLT